MIRSRSFLFLLFLAFLVSACSESSERGSANSSTEDQDSTLNPKSEHLDSTTAPDSTQHASRDSLQQADSSLADDKEELAEKVKEVAEYEKAPTMKSSNALVQSAVSDRSGSRFNREDYEHTPANRYKQVKAHPLSTFSIDVDRASYSNARRFINNDKLPPKDAVRAEEFINYFEYEYPEPQGKHPFSIDKELASCPWQKDHQLLKIGLQGKKIEKANAAPSNLVFLLDVSGSMQSPKKLDLVKRSMKLLTGELRAKDRISIVVYAGASGVVLEPTSGANKEKIRKALERLRAGGSTAGSKGIKLAYKMAEKNYMEKGNNRVILATDGDFNVGVTSDGGLVRLIEKKREKGVFLSVLGFGTGNYQGGKMEQLSNKGNGNYSYIDNILEAKKTMVNEFGGTMYTIAKDVKIQVEFNPAKVGHYRLIGYANRQLDKEDFNNDSVDAGELGSGHSVTALYELVPPDQEPPKKPGKVDSLKYQSKKTVPGSEKTNELGTVKFRYKKPDGEKSIRIEEPIADKADESPSDGFKWAASTAMFAMQLKDDPYKGSTSYEHIRSLAKKSKGKDEWGYRSEFIKLVRKASALQATASNDR
ncbi:MAG: von Willebrand factor type A domain-containing protein [Flavobacteriales bacterium]